MVPIAASQSSELTSAQTTLVVVGVILAVAAAVVTNVVVARRGHVKATLDQEIADLEERIRRAHSALLTSLETNRAARILWAMIELRATAPDAFYEHYFHTVVGWFAQAGMDAVNGLSIDVDPDQKLEDRSEVRAILDARADASTNGPRSLDALAQRGSEARDRLLPYTSDRVTELGQKILKRSEHERTTLRVVAAGTSVQILSLVAIAAKDLL